MVCVITLSFQTVYKNSVMDKIHSYYVDVTGHQGVLYCKVTLNLQ